MRTLPGLRDPIVLALPRGGVPVAYEVARAIGAPLDVLVVRKLGAPGQEELAIGAVASGGSEHLNRELIAALGLSLGELNLIRERERAEVRRRTARYRGDRPWPDLHGRSVIVVDDGAATGATAQAAIAALRGHRPAEVIVALPVAPADACRQLQMAADRVVCLRSPAPFLAIGNWYVEFGQVSDEEVRDLLPAAAPANEADRPAIGPWC
ncbi:MAG TPA: phosphoribosyltransferase family protein [Patescibacteria group bacterium]|nr:phosphoribosyltransferase family protein [Patescibacteria group bacterium]